MIPQYETEFINECFTRISAELEKPEEIVELEAPKSLSKFAWMILEKKSISNNHRKIIKALNVLRELIRNSDKDGPNGLKPHLAL